MSAPRRSGRFGRNETRPSVQHQHPGADDPDRRAAGGGPAGDGLAHGVVAGTQQCRVAHGRARVRRRQLADRWLRTIAAVGQTLSQAPSFAIGAGAAFDDERRRQLVSVLDRYPAMAAAYVGYADGRFIYAGRSDVLGSALRTELGAPQGSAILVRTIEGADDDRWETWWFRTPDGGRTEARVRPAQFDPRARSWFRDALATDRPW